MSSFWITSEKTANRSAIYRFSKTVRLDKNAVVSMKISADTRYKFYVNGNYICEGPCTGEHSSQRYEEITVDAEFLRDGDNEFVVKVMHVTDANIYAIQSRKNRVALWIEGSIKGSGEIVPFLSDESWACVIEDGVKLFKGPGVLFTMPPMESIDTNAGTTESKSVLYFKNNLSASNFDHYGLSNEYIMQKRPIPLMDLHPEEKFKVVKSGKGFVELDTGAYTTAYPTFEFKCAKGEKIKFIYAECYAKKDEFNERNGRLLKGARDDSSGIIDGVYDEVIANGERQTYTPYSYRAFRYVRAEFPESAEFDFSKQYFSKYLYPLNQKGFFECADDIKNKIWDISINTVLCCTHDTFVDCPYYEQAQYDMDSALEMMFMFRLTDDYSICRKAVYDLAFSQQTNGFLLAHYPSTAKQIIPTFSLFWILMFRDYVFYTGDLAAAKELVPVADRILNAFERIKTDEGIVGVTPYWHYTDWVPGWDIGIPPMGNKKPLAVSSLLYAYALEQASELCGWISRNGLAEEYKNRKSSIISAANKYFYDSEKQFYTDTYGSSEKTYSVHTAVWAVLSEAVKGEEAIQLLERGFASEVSRASFSFNYYTFRALEKTRLYKKYSPHLFKGWYKMLDLNCTTWCENPDNPRSECHGWSSAPIYEFSNMLMGVKPVDIGFSKVIIEPDIQAEKFLKGSVPTPKGEIFVEWKTEGGKTLFKLSSPEGIEKSIRLPGMAQTVTKEKNFEITL